MRNLIAIIILAVTASLATAEDSRLETLRTGDDLGGWSGVGRLEIAGKGFCTAALISESHVLTAAHCLFDSDGIRVEAARLTFAAGLRDGRALTSRAVRSAVLHADYQHNAPSDQFDFGSDMALLELQQPIRGTQVRPYEVAGLPRGIRTVGVVSYAKDRPEAPALQRSCAVIEAVGSAMILTCNVDFGSSGAPVFATGLDGVERIVGVVTAKAQVEGQDVAVSAMAGPSVAGLRTALGALEEDRINSLPGQVRVIAPGERNSDLGAKFIRP